MAGGMDPGRFWGLAPREIMTVLEGVRDRLTREHNDRAWLAWHAAHLPGNSKIRFTDLTAGKTASRRAKTPEEEFAAFASWAEARKH